MGVRSWGAIALGAVVAVAAAWMFVSWDGAAPAISAPAEIAVGREARAIEIEVTDAESGLRGIEAVLRHARGEAPLVTREYAGSGFPPTRPTAEQLSIQLDPQALDLPEGNAFLRISARDGSWRNRLRGNEATLDVPVAVDLTPPRIEVESGLTYVRRGGAATIVYAVSEPTERDGVQVGERLFRGFELGSSRNGAGPGARRVAIFAIAVDGPEEPPVRVIAVDPAGNGAVAPLRTRIQERSFPEVTVNLSRGFLEGKVAGLGEAQGLGAGDGLAAFRAINTDMRARDEGRIRELLRESAPTPLFQGAFEQLRSSKVTSRFAEKRSYRFGGQAVGGAIHYGFDLAATLAAPVTASNAGRVIFAGDLGIYGQSVLVDHGLGVASLYGHLSRLDVSAGHEVTKGQVLGLSGESGLAGGDHLHFAILVQGVYVDPLEWWDDKWVREHVEVRLGSPGA